MPGNIATPAGAGAQLDVHADARARSDQYVRRLAALLAAPGNQRKKASCTLLASHGD